MIKLKNVSRLYPAKAEANGGVIRALDNFSLNVDPDLTHFAAIVPCGVADPRYGVTSLADLGLPVTMTDVDAALWQAFEEVFGSPVLRVPKATI